MSREQVFDTEMKKFFDICVKILESHQKSFFTINTGSDNHVLRNLQRYRIVYNMTDVQTHIPYFQKMFRNYRDELLEVLKDDHWLLTENVVIQFGEELEDEELRKRSEKRKIEISAIYKYATQLRKTIEESLKGLPDSAQEQSQELIYPEIFLLHLFRVLYAIYPQNKEIQRNIQTIEKELGVISPVKKSSNPLENLAENAKQIFGNVLPSNLKLPTNEEMSQKLEQAFKDPVVSETLGTTVNSLMNAKNLGEGIGAAIKSLENPKFMDGLLKAVQTLIPQETLDTITKSAENLKESGEIKNALDKMGIPTDIDISKMLKEGPGMELSKVLSPPSDMECKDDTVCQLPSTQDSELSVEQVASNQVNSVTNDSVTIGKTEVEITQPSGNGSMEQMLQSFMKTIPPELTEMFSKFQTPSNNTQGPQKSLIDF